MIVIEKLGVLETGRKTCLSTHSSLEHFVLSMCYDYVYRYRDGCLSNHKRIGCDLGMYICPGFVRLAADAGDCPAHPRPKETKKKQKPGAGKSHKTR